MRTGKIDLAVGEAFITDQFSEALQQFMGTYPGMTVRVKVSGTNDAVALVRDDEAHFGLIFDVPRDPKVRVRLSFDQPLKVVIHPPHELAKRESVSLAELTRYSIGLPEFLAKEELSAGKLKAVPTTNAVLNSTKISLITRAGRQIPMGVYRLLQRVEGYLRGSIPQAA